MVYFFFLVDAKLTCSPVCGVAEMLLVAWLICAAPTARPNFCVVDFLSAVLLNSSFCNLF